MNWEREEDKISDSILKYSRIEDLEDRQQDSVLQRHSHNQHIENTLFHSIILPRLLSSIEVASIFYFEDIVHK